MTRNLCFVGGTGSMYLGTLRYSVSCGRRYRFLVPVCLLRHLRRYVYYCTSDQETPSLSQRQFYSMTECRYTAISIPSTHPRDAPS